MDRIRCPKVLYFLSLILVVFPLVYLVFSAFVFELSSRGILNLILSPLFYLSSIFWIITGLGLQRMRQWSWYTFGVAQFFTLYLNARNLVENSQSEYKGLAFVVGVLIQAYTLILVARGIRVPYLFPKIRWWESGTAGMTQIPVVLFHVSSASGTSHAQLLDLHPRGCFIKTPLDFELFEKIQIRIDSYGHKVDVSGHVVWNAKSTVTHPRGIGVQFVDLDRHRRRKIKVLTQRFIKQRESKDVRTKLSQKSA